MARTEGRSSLKLQVQLQATDTGEKFRLQALVDSGASGLFINSDYIRQSKIVTKSLSHPILVNNMDRTPNEQGPIREVAEFILSYKGHSESTVFAVTCLGKEKMILGLPWLREHNLEVD